MVLIEAAIDSLADAERAVREGAGRLEVCADLSVGGLTPTRALLTGCLALGVPCVAMARPRAGGFVHTRAEFAQLCTDASDMLSLGATGVVFGCLRVDRTVDADAVRSVVRIAGQASTAFHRAFDDTPDAFAALDTLMLCGVRRILTSGHARTAFEGIDQIAALVARGGPRIAILPGGSVRRINVREVVARSGVNEIHARGSDAGVISGLRAELQ